MKLPHACPAQGGLCCGKTYTLCCTRRKSDFGTFGQGFDSPRLHQDDKTLEFLWQKYKLSFGKLMLLFKKGKVIVHASRIGGLFLLTN